MVERRTSYFTNLELRRSRLVLRNGAQCTLRHPYRKVHRARPSSECMHCYGKEEIMARIVSPDRALGKRVSRWVAKLIGLIPKAYNEVRGFSLTPDGQLFYCACRGSECFIVHGTTEGKAYTDIWGFSLTTDVQPLYCARRGPERFIVHGKTEGKVYDWVSDLTLTPDGKLLYCVRRVIKQFVVHGTTKGKAYDEVWKPTLTPDGKPLYRARRGSEYLIVHGKTEGRAYDELFSLRVVGNEIVYGARKGRRIVRVARTIAA